MIVGRLMFLRILEGLLAFTLDVANTDVSLCNLIVSLGNDEER